MKRGVAFPKRISKGRVLCHNHILYQGFRAWTDVKPPPGFVRCPCGFAGLPHYARRAFVVGRAWTRWNFWGYARR